MKKPNKTPTTKPLVTPVPRALPRTPKIPPSALDIRSEPPQQIKETDEQKQARVEAANKALKALCEQYHVSFHVPHLDISSGKIWPVIQLMALDLP